MHLSVCICTWNRAALLDKTLAQLKQLSIPPGLDWELLVVNNNCTDETDLVLNRYAVALPLRRLYEARPGLSHARNCAIDAAQGDLLVWTDDDVLVDSQWLAAYCEAAGRCPQAAFFGGPIRPWFEAEPPSWLLECWDNLSGMYAVRELGDDEFALDTDHLPYGANYAIRADVQRKHRYDVNLGRQQNNMVSGEETAVLAAILAEGGSGHWLPGAKVRHFIPAERLTLNYLRQFFYGLGRTFVRGGRTSRASAAKLRMRAALSELKFRAGRRVAPARYWVKHLTTAERMRGELAERKRAA